MIFRVLDDVIVRDDEAVLRDDETLPWPCCSNRGSSPGRGGSRSCADGGRKQAFEADGAGLDADDGGGHARGQIGEARGDPNGLGLLDPALERQKAPGQVFRSSSSSLPKKSIARAEVGPKPGAPASRAGRGGRQRRGRALGLRPKRSRRMEKGSLFRWGGLALPVGIPDRRARATVAPSRPRYWSGIVRWYRPGPRWTRTSARVRPRTLAIPRRRDS